MTRTETAAGKRKAVKATPAEVRDKRARRAAVLLKQASDPTRLQVMLLLGEGEKHVGAICDTLAMTQPAVSHHLALLRHGGLVAARRQGKNCFYELTESGAELAEVVSAMVD